MKLTRIKVSSILHQVKQGDAPLEYVWPWPDHPNPAHVLMFRNPASYEVDGKWGWYWMRVWITDNNRRGYLRDDRCPFELVRDVPFQLLWEELQEIYVLGKLADDPLIIGPRFETANPRPCHPERLARRLNLIYDLRYPQFGYENNPKNQLSVYERRAI